MKYLCKILVVLITLSLIAYAKATSQKQITQAYFQGQTLFQQQKFSQAYPLLMMSAKQGNANAIYAVGYMMYNGLGVPRDQVQALLWLQKAAKLGNIRAIEALQRLDTAN